MPEPPYKYFFSIVQCSFKPFKDEAFKLNNKQIFTKQRIFEAPVWLESMTFTDPYFFSEPKRTKIIQWKLFQESKIKLQAFFKNSSRFSAFNNFPVRFRLRYLTGFWICLIFLLRHTQKSTDIVKGLIVSLYNWSAFAKGLEEVTNFPSWKYAVMFFLLQVVGCKDVLLKWMN